MYWNQGRTVPRLPMLVKLCRLLSCRIEDLLEMDLDALDRGPDDNRLP